MSELRLFLQTFGLTELLNAHTYDSHYFNGDLKASWKFSSDTYYTAILTNLTTNYVHYLAINIPGCDMIKSTALLPYESINNYTDNLYTIKFAIYIQPNYIEPVIISQRTPMKNIPMDKLFIQHYKLKLAGQISFLLTGFAKKISSPRPSTSPRAMIAPASPRRSQPSANPASAK